MQMTPPDVLESRVLIIITGGTICMSDGPDGLVPVPGFLKSALAPRPSFNDNSYPEPLHIHPTPTSPLRAVQSLRTPRSSYHRTIRYSVLEFPTLLDSSSISASGWDQIALTISSNYELWDGFVVLHGTDSLAYTAAALSFMLQNLGKPVILTGSQAPIALLQNDAVDNLLSSLVIAGHFMIPEVCLFFNFKLFRGNRATKVSADDFDAFASPNLPPLGTVGSTRTNVAWELVQRPREVGRLSVQTGLDTAHVACLRVFPGMRAEMLDAVLRLQGLKGLVLETFGAGNAPGDKGVVRVLEEAVGRGIVVVNVTQCLAGSVRPVYAAGEVLRRAGVVFGLDLTSEAALAKLSYLLSLKLSPAEVAKRMSISLRGELSEDGDMMFQHPGVRPMAGGLQVDSLKILAERIRAGDHAGVKEILQYDQRWLLNDQDEDGNTSLHLAASSPEVSILRDFLSQGASVHLRNKTGHTPLFVAAQLGTKEQVDLLQQAGAHLHAEELEEAQRLASGSGPAASEDDSPARAARWQAAGL